MERKLNLGCGTKIKTGWINLDVAKLPGVDVVHDVEKLPLPFAEEEFDEILCEDVLEHVEYVPLLRDLHRILKKGGALSIQVPHFTSRNNFIDPTHKKLFSVNTFDFFVENSRVQREREYYFDFTFGKVLERRITFQSPRESKLLRLNSLTERLINKSFRRQELYEMTFLSRLFPALNVIIRLRK